MELRRLRLLHEFARRGTVAAVAEALSYSPSSVSVQLAELEREAGVPLLRRAGRTLELTPAGARLAEHAAQRADGGRGGAGGARRAQRHAARAGADDVRADARARAAVHRAARAGRDGARAARRGHAPRDRAGASRRCARARSTSSSASTTTRCPVPRHRDVDREDLIREAVLLCVPTDHPLAAAPGPISLAAFEHAAWAADFPGSGHRTALEHLCNRLGGYAPDIVHHTDDALILRALVASGRAVTILAALIAAATPQARRAADRRGRRAPHDLHRDPRVHRRRPRDPGRPASAPPRGRARHRRPRGRQADRPAAATPRA